MEYNTRFKGAPYMGVVPKLTITLIGNGGIGSWLGMDLAKIGPNAIMNYEFDLIDAANVGGQNFTKNDIGKPKADIMAQISHNTGNYYNWLNIGEFKPDSAVSEVVFCCVDSNDIRRMIYDSWVKDCQVNGFTTTVTIVVDEEVKTVTIPKMFIDARMSFDAYNVYCVTEKDHINHGLYRIPPSSTIADDSCSTKANPDIGKAAAADQLRVFKNVIDNSLGRADGMDIDIVSAPYCLTYDKNYFTLIKEDTCIAPKT